MGATRKPTTSDAEYARHRAYYLKNRDRIIANGKRAYQEQRPMFLAKMAQMREELRQERLRTKRKDFYETNGKPMPGHSKKRERRLGRQFVADYKTGKACTDCRNFYPPCVLDFDHVRGTKRSDLSTMVWQGRSLHVLQSEIDKCDLVCANCHRIRTHTRSTPT